MNNFQTVFEIAQGPSEIQMDIYGRLVIGIIVLILAIVSLLLYVKRRKNKEKPRLYTVIFLSVWAVGWLGFTISWLLNANTEHVSLLTAYQTGNYEVAEGFVHVNRMQPEAGHAPGDMISIGDRQFEINFFISTQAYHKTIAHGGVLKEGVYAKVFHYNGEIIRIDLKKGSGQQINTAESQGGVRVPD